MSKGYVADLASVIVCVYNLEPYLRACLDSIVNQTYQNLEIIVVDNESTDGSGAICDEYAQRDKRIKVIHRSHGCTAAYTRNTGLENVQGEYCFHVDGDDWIEPDTIHYCVQKFKQNPNVNILAYGISFWSLNQENATWQRDKFSFKHPEEKLYKDKEVLDLFVSGALLPTPWQRAYRTYVLQDLRFIEQSDVVEDGPFLLELCQKPGLSLLTLPTQCYNYRWLRPGSLTNKKFYMWDGSFRGFEQVLTKPTFATLPLEIKRGSILLVASFLRRYLIEFYGWVDPNVPMSEEDQKFYDVLLRFQRLVTKYRSLLPWSVDGLIVRILINNSPERVLAKMKWLERFIRLFRLKSNLYVE